eukprot:TRINITY_DN30612_c0_g1_i1.p1 TRINITY_DN30612_c0_g1~~TRINITY_DN30612_c0_g1_i1.p1  ORF type:complete len:293 (+),score=127.16 TRINITY_DN30612_c0_g1_i1:67-879(+)
MAGRRFDQRTTTFSPEGRLFQVEYAMAAIGNAPTTLGMLTKDGVILCAEKPVQSALLDRDVSQEQDISAEKMFLIDDHIAVSVAGYTADALQLIRYMRISAQRHTYSYGEPVPLETLVSGLCDLKQGYTQYGGQRPFGVSFLHAGWDVQYGFQLYHSDPSGNFAAWKANAVGQHTDNAQSVLKQEWKEGLSLHEGLLLATKTLGKCMDTSSLTPEKMEFGTITKEEGKPPKFHILTDQEAKAVLDEAAKIREEEERQKEKERKEKSVGSK